MALNTQQFMDIFVGLLKHYVHEYTTNAIFLAKGLDNGESDAEIAYNSGRMDSHRHDILDLLYAINQLGKEE